MIPNRVKKHNELYGIETSKYQEKQKNQQKKKKTYVCERQKEKISKEQQLD